MKGQTQKRKILALLQSGKPIRETTLSSLCNFSGNHYNCISELRKEGYLIKTTYKLDDTFYQLKEGKRNDSNTNFATSLQAA